MNVCGIYFIYHPAKGWPYPVIIKVNPGFYSNVQIVGKFKIANQSYVESRRPVNMN